MPAHRLIPGVRLAGDRTDGNTAPAAPAPACTGLRQIRPTRAEIDLVALVENARRLAQRVAPADVLAVVKADAYGHGAVRVARALADLAPIGGLAVSLAEEGLELRAAGVSGPVLVMGGVYDGAHRDLVTAELVPVVTTLADVAAFARFQERVTVHAKIDTGMARLGVLVRDLAGFLEGCARFPNVRVAGVMTHLASADCDPELTRAQLQRLAAAVAVVRARVAGPLLVHAANTAAIFNFAESHLGAVRPGLALYGGGAPGLAPVMRLVTGVVALRDVEPGDTVSYGAHFRAARRSRIATLPAGYADGYPRRLSGHLQPPGDPTPVLIHGRRCPVVGAVCMDMLMVDVTDLGPAVSVGDEAVLLGRQAGDEITAAELARRAGLIEYEITCGVSRRVPRVPSVPDMDVA
jgi:alanine racemase